jgi:prolipoprotein diacylglyceryl transferase
MSRNMPVSYIPSPSRGVWQLGPVPLRAYALCMVVGIAVAVWLTDRRYRAAGGRPGVIIDVAAWAVPSGLVGARLYSVITDYQLYFGLRTDWAGVFRVWDGGLGIPGAIVLGAAGAWFGCRRAGVPLGPVAGAAAPGLALGLAIGSLGIWFDQDLYGRPSTLPWALEISPAHRLTGYESYASFQPVFLYDIVWDLLVAAVVIWVAHRFLLSGDRTFALFVAAYSVGMFVTQTIRIDYSHHILGLRINEWVALLAFAGAAGYLIHTHKPRSEGAPSPSEGGEAPAVSAPAPAETAT